jgi:hypothetical protein
MPDRSARKLASYFSSETLFSLGMPRDMQALPQLSLAWAETVGEPLVQHVIPLRYSDGCLSLQADSSVWASKIRHQQQALIDQLRAHPALRQLSLLKVRIAPLQRERVKPLRKPSLKRPSVETLTLLAQVADDITDPGLRDALKRLGRPRKS